MATDEYNGWTNRETWAVALWIDNDQGLQEWALEIATAVSEAGSDHKANRLGAALQEWIEEMSAQIVDEPETTTRDLRLMFQDIGSLWRVDWDEIGASFLQAVQEQS